MEISFREMELLSRSLNQAHRAAIQTELNAAGLEKVGHPMLVSILQSAEEDPGGQCQAQRELADLLHVSPAAVANSLKCLERDGYVRRVSVRMMAGFTEEELQQLAWLQRRMLDNLTAPDSHEKE